MGEWFQSTPAHDGRQAVRGGQHGQELVSIHARTRRATGPVRSSRALRRFQSTPAHDGRPAGRPVPVTLQTFQSTPAHDGRPRISSRTSGGSGVSIHARTRRATVTSGIADVPYYVSIHARTRRATKHRMQAPGLWHCFNPRPHTTGDSARAGVPRSRATFQSTPAHDGRHGDTQETAEGHAVSIHARTRRATPGPAERSAVLVVSIHARTRRATEPLDLVQVLGKVSIHARTRRATCGNAESSPRSMFQSTPAHDGRLRACGPGFATSWFQSTPAHDGRPAADPRLEQALAVSIHARTRRATRPHLALPAPWTSFNPRPHTTGDRRFCSPSCLPSGFNPRPHTTGDHHGPRRSQLKRGFNPRPHTTGDGDGCGDGSGYGVSIHARTRRATTAMIRFPCFKGFQSTPAHDGRLGHEMHPIVIHRFNPRPHTTGDEWSHVAFSFR